MVDNTSLDFLGSLGMIGRLKKCAALVGGLLATLFMAAGPARAIPITETYTDIASTSPSFNMATFDYIFTLTSVSTTVDTNPVSPNPMPLGSTPYIQFNIAFTAALSPPTSFTAVPDLSTFFGTSNNVFGGRIEIDTNKGSSAGSILALSNGGLGVPGNNFQANYYLDLYNVTPTSGSSTLATGMVNLVDNYNNINNVIVSEPISIALNGGVYTLQTTVPLSAIGVDLTNPFLHYDVGLAPEPSFGYLSTQSPSPGDAPLDADPPPNTPEPSTLVLGLGVGLGALAFRRWRQHVQPIRP
jgi:hypothetical protein